MKKVSLINRVMTVVVMLGVATSLAFADGETSEVYLKGTSHSSAGDFVVQTTNDIFQYQGREYDVFRVYYDNPDMNIKIAVNTEGKCTSFIAFNEDFMLFYNCNKNGFGVRKIMFSNPWAKQQFNAQEFHDQTVLLKQKSVDKKQAVGLIASYLPQLKG